MSGEVPVVNRPTAVRLECGAVARVRRAKASKQAEFMESARMREGEPAGDARFSQLLVRWGLVGIEGAFTDPDTGQAVEFKVAGHPALGSMASVEVFDALTTKDTVRLMAMIGGAPEAAARAAAWDQPDAGTAAVGDTGKN